VRTQLIGRRSDCELSGSFDARAFTMFAGTTCTGRCEADHAQHWQLPSAEPQRGGRVIRAAPNQGSWTEDR
jgi:hypothetical protein